MMKRRKAEPQPASRDAIRKHHAQFITDLPIRYRRIESGYNRSLYAVMAECATLAQLAAERSDIAEEIRTGKHWKDKRQQCPAGELIKLVVHHTLQPKGRNEQSKASKWTAVIERLSDEGLDGVPFVEALSKRGGIEEIYAETTGRNAAEAKSMTGGARERIDGVIASDFYREEDEAETEAGQDGEDAKRTKTTVLEVIVKSITLIQVLDSEIVDLRLTIGGPPISGKPKGFKRVVGCIKRIRK